MAAEKVLVPMVAAFAVLLATTAIFADAHVDIFSIITSMNQAADSIPQFRKDYKNVKKSDEYGEIETISELPDFLGKVGRPCDGVCRCVCFRVFPDPFPICKCASNWDLLKPAVQEHGELK